MGQSRAEHEACVSVTAQQLVAEGFYSDEGADAAKGPTAVCFSRNGTRLPPPKLQFPYLPSIYSSNGKKMIAACQQVGQDPLIVHEICALQMFQARANRTR